MHVILCRISEAVNSFEKGRGFPPHHLNLPLRDAEELAAVEWDQEDSTELADDLPEHEILVGRDAVEGVELFGAVIHVDPAATQISCS
jgi:hypothetical protein